VRLHDQTGSKRKITLSPIFKFTGWCETNLMKTPTHDMIDSTSGNIQLELLPFEVKTILIK
jgi:alpha-mannosidase